MDGADSLLYETFFLKPRLVIYNSPLRSNLFSLRASPSIPPLPSMCRGEFDMDAGFFGNPMTVEEVFADFKARRAGIVKALTRDVAEFYRQCDPERDNLCLYGLPNGKWELDSPAEYLPPELPEPALGINFVTDGMLEKDWLPYVAVQSDAWLLSVAFFFGAKSSFDKADRKRLFHMLNELPTVFEVVTGTAKKPAKDNSSNGSKHKSEANSKGQPGKQEDEDNLSEEEEEEEVEEEEEEHGDALCGDCGESYASNEFWICCDICETWFHGKCVKITPARAKHMKQYKCSSCTNKRA